MGSFFRRIGWGLLATLFLATGLGVGVVAFWQATHQKNNNQNQTQSCSFASVSNLPVNPVPEIYKISSAVTSLQSADLTAGSGPAAKAGDCLTVKYYGTIASDGTKFDENFTQPTGLKFQLGVSEVIPGWDQGLVGTKAGGIRRLVIPASLAYGSRGVCQTPNAQDQTKCDVYVIKPNTDLVFVVDLISIQ